MLRATIPMLALLLILAPPARGGQVQDYGTRLGQGYGADVQYPAQGREVLLDALDPRVQKWYLPQELDSEYRFDQWAYTNYARDFYTRYKSAALEGDYFYDVFGRSTVHGWLVYEARQEQPRASEGNSLLKAPGYGGTFRNLVVASDVKGQHRVSLMVGDEIRTTLTPMTFRKATFNGVQLDYLSDRYAGTVLLTRPSAPLVTTSAFGIGVTNSTDLTGGRAVVQLSDAVSIGGTYVNTHNTRATLERFQTTVFETAEFMASYPVWRSQDRRYVLGPPLIPAQERFPPLETYNPAFELEYWVWGLEMAQCWRERLGLGRSAAWQRVREHMSRLPIVDGCYVNAESHPDTFGPEGERTDHPSLLGACGILPGISVDKEIMRRTLLRVMDTWEWDATWGWDFPMTAMTAARVGEPQLAVDALLMDAERNTYLLNGHNYNRWGLSVYLPGNGGLLTAVAMMAAGWDGAPDSNAQGFPKDGAWSVRWEGLQRMP